MNKATKKILLNYILAPILFGLLLWLIYRQLQLKGNIAAQWADLKVHWQQGSSLLLLLVALMAPVNWMLEAKKWQFLLQKIEPLPFIKAFASTLTGIAFALVTPNKIGDFAGRILYLKDKNKLRAVIATLVGNLAQTIITFGFGIIGLLYFNIYYPATWTLITLLGALAACGLLLFCYLRIDLFATWAEGKTWLRKVTLSLRILKRYNRQDLQQLLVLSFIRFCIYNLQFLILANVLGASLPWFSGFWISGLMFWMITVIPSLFIADLGVRGFIAALIFTQTGISDNNVALLAASYLIWFLNLVVPALIGSVLILTVRIIR